MKRLAAYILQSLNDPSSSSPERQLEIIEAWAKVRGVIIAHIYQDVGGKRSESDNIRTRPQFQELLIDAEALKFDTLVVSSQERFGSSSIYQYIRYMARFLDLKIEVWNASTNSLLNVYCIEATGILQSTSGSIVDTSEQMTRSRNTITGQTTKARKGSYLGGFIAYGIAIQCVTQDGVVRWISEMVGKKLYETVYTDGRVTVEQYTLCGNKAPSDRLSFCRSRYNVRIVAVQQVFRSFLSGTGTNKIAEELNSLAYRLPGGRLFYGAFVRNILEYGHMYTGRVAFYKANKGKCYQGNKNFPVLVKNLKGKTRTKHSIDDWLISDEVFEPIISMEDYRRAHDLLVSKARPRTRQNQKAIYAGLLMCENCGMPMTACGNEYRSITYMKTDRKRVTCTCNSGKVSIIDGYGNKWLEETSQTLAWTDEEAPIISLYKIRNINRAHNALIVGVEHYRIDKWAYAGTYKEQSDGSRVVEIPGQEIEETIEGAIARDIVHRFKLPGYDGDPSFLQNLLGTIESSENKNTLSSIVKLEARKSHILSIFSEALNRSLCDSLVRELNILDSQIELARTGVTDYAKQHRELIIQLREIYKYTKTARTTSQPQAKRKALLKLITEIRCKCVKSVWGRKRVVYKVAMIIIIPEVGD